MVGTRLDATPIRALIVEGHRDICCYIAKYLEEAELRAGVRPRRRVCPFGWRYGLGLGIVQ